MHKYKVVYIDAFGEERTVVLYAPAENYVNLRLVDAMRILCIKDYGQSIPIPKFLQESLQIYRLSHKEMADLLRNIAYTHQAGLTVIDSLLALAVTGTKRQIYVCNQLLLHLSEGLSLAEAFNIESHLLPLNIGGIIAASSKAGTLDGTLFSLAEQMEDYNKITSKIKTIMAYPLFIVLVTIVAVVFLCSSIIPQVAKIIQEIDGVALPESIQAILRFNEFIKADGSLFITIFCLLLILLLIVLSRLIHKVRDIALIHIPVLGRIIRAGDLVHFLSHFAFLIEAGFSNADAFSASLAVMQNGYLKKHLEQSYKAVIEGQSLTNAMTLSKLFSRAELQMIDVGEKSGALRSVFRLMSKRLSDEADRDSQRFMQLVEPVVMIIIGLLVGAIMLFIYEPLFELVSMI